MVHHVTRIKNVCNPCLFFSTETYTFEKQARAGVHSVKLARGKNEVGTLQKVE